VLSRAQFVAAQKVPTEAVASLGKVKEPGAQFPEMSKQQLNKMAIMGFISCKYSLV